MKSVGQQIQQLQGLLGTDAVSEWETTFISDIAAKTNDGRRTTHLSEKQVEKLDQIYREHFA